MTRLGLVGLGNWGHRLARSVVQVKGTELASCFARDRPRREAFAARHGCRPAASLDELWAEDLDGVMIATPHSTHVELTLSAITAGLAVMVEKPLALSVEDARRCVDAADKAETLLQVAHYRRRLPATRRVKALIDDGVLGHLHLVEGHFSRRLGPNHDRPWRDDPSEAPVGAMTALGVHMADNLLYFAGSAGRVSAFSTRIGRVAEIDDMSGALIEFESGAIGVLTTSLRIPKVVSCAAHGTEMVAWSDHDGSRLFTLEGDSEERVEHEVGKVDPVVDNLAHFVGCIRDGRRPETGGAEGLAVVEILEAMSRSATAGGASIDLATLR